MTLPEQIEQLKEDYERRIVTVNKMLHDLNRKNTPETVSRLETKRGEYNAFLADLNRLKEPQP